MDEMASRAARVNTLSTVLAYISTDTFNERILCLRIDLGILSVIPREITQCEADESNADLSRLGNLLSPQREPPLTSFTVGGHGFVNQSSIEICGGAIVLHWPVSHTHQMGPRCIEEKKIPSSSISRPGRIGAEDIGHSEDELDSLESVETQSEERTSQQWNLPVVGDPHLTHNDGTRLTKGCKTALRYLKVLPQLGASHRQVLTVDALAVEAPSRTGEGAYRRDDETHRDLVLVTLIAPSSNAAVSADKIMSDRSTVQAYATWPAGGLPWAIRKRSAVYVLFSALECSRVQ
jgi:hypothetical protein